ncbi:glycosyltransferase family 2 protein [Sneathiella sp.]|uniref:glycosyltransferase family 2 protein n=1 Tax=Sneathiella sp. TaxID=1964365 RepID=UPI00260F076A|nr:glycosyltransferase family 2 protein [Sneathiella sp.]MDF2368163.1 glycosyltransferase family 2 protein [Sneathiella sp.]
MSNNRISVVMPAYNCDETICITLDSLINQQRPPDEIIVVDDLSANPVANVLGDRYPEVRIIRHEVNKGVQHARNTGFAEATGDYIYFLDADDILCPEFLKVMLAALEGTPDAAAAFGSFYKCFDGNAAPILEGHEEQLSEVKMLSKGEGLTFYLENTGAFIPSFSIFRKSALDRISHDGILFLPDLSNNEDFQMFARILATFDVLHIVNPMGVYFLRPDSISRNLPKVWLSRAVAVDSLIKGADDLKLSAFHLAFLKRLRASSARQYARVLANSGDRKQAYDHLFHEFKRSPQIKTLALLLLILLGLQKKKIEYGGMEY